ncbi:MAG: hypothetical protein ABR568_00795 [Pyrinomonadaceae bacterium]
MSKEEWEDAYHSAWKTYYTDDHIETILRRAIATGTSPGKTMFFITWFKGCIGIEEIHPLEGGFLRLKFRGSLRLRLIYRKVRKDPQRFEYMDLALEPVRDDEIETRELFQSETAQKYLAQMKRLEKIRHLETDFDCSRAEQIIRLCENWANFTIR